MQSEAFCCFHVLVPSPAFLLLDIRVIHLPPTAGLVEWTVLWIGKQRGWERSSNKQDHPLLLFMPPVVLSEWLLPTPGEQKVKLAALMEPGLLQGQISLRSDELLALIPVSQLNGHAAGVTDLPKARCELSSTVKTEVHTLWHSPGLFIERAKHHN